MFAFILSGLAIGTFAGALAFGLLGDAHTAAYLMTGSFIVSILAVIKGRS